MDDQIRQLNGKLPPDERESAIAIIEHSGPPPDACQAYAQLSGVAAVLSMYHALHVGGGGGPGRSRGDARGLMRVLATLPNCQAQRAFEDPFLHTLVGSDNRLAFFSFRFHVKYETFNREQVSMQ